VFGQRLSVAQIFVLIGHVILRIGAQMLDEGLARLEACLRCDFDHFGSDAGDFGKAQIMDCIGAHIGRGKTAHAVCVIALSARCIDNARRAFAAIGGVFVGVEIAESGVSDHHRPGDRRLCARGQRGPIVLVDRGGLFACEGLPKARLRVVVDDARGKPFAKPLHRLTRLRQPARDRPSAAFNSIGIVSLKRLQSADITLKIGACEQRRSIGKRVQTIEPATAIGEQNIAAVIMRAGGNCVL